MSRGRKRKLGDYGASRITDNANSNGESLVNPQLLVQCYGRVSSLRDHLLAKLPSSSRLRRKKIASIGLQDNCGALEQSVKTLLETTYVCFDSDLPCDAARVKEHDARWEQWLSFSQKGGDESYVTLADGSVNSIYSQSEIVDFVIWLLFSREKKLSSWPKHLLCDGFRRGTRPNDQGGTAIPDIFALFPNDRCKTLKESPWPQLLSLLGKEGERIMIDLLLDCCMFVPIKAGFQNYYQLSGTPLSEKTLSGNLGEMGRKPPRKLSDITLVRSRIFYAKPALTARGLIQAGFKHIHALNRCSYKPKSMENGGQDDMLHGELQCRKLMMYMFPRQFGMHNVFTSQVDTMKTAQKFQDYTLREEEISELLAPAESGGKQRLPKVPKRLRGAAERLVRRLQVLHHRCSYWKLLRHYCPSMMDPLTASPKSKSSRRLQQIAGNPTQPRTSIRSSISQSKRRLSRKRPAQTQAVGKDMNHSIFKSATPAPHVSAFCQAVLRRIIPQEFWGLGDSARHNQSLVLGRVDHFVRLRRFESLSLHEIMQGLKMTEIGWLRPPDQHSGKLSQTDLEKRAEILQEFLYYVFDSLLIPLIRTNFYVTESNSHRYQVFYFRHDVWRSFSEPAMAKLRDTMFTELDQEEAVKILDGRLLGFSQIRLLPKKSGLRPIMNLRKRALGRGPKKTLGPSINSVLGPIHSILKLEKDIHPSKLGATMFSVSEIYERLKRFKETLGASNHNFYFAKLDVKAAFDTIPQEAVTRLMASVPSQAEYTITKHAEVKAGDVSEIGQPKTAAKPIRRWHATALADGQPQAFAERVERNLGARRKNTVFVDSAVRKVHDTAALIHLLHEHVSNNIVKLGKKYYRQQQGIPQGSVLSSFLCNYFYADLEKQRLQFLDAPDSLLLRLIDDFLLITLDKTKAVRFVETMHTGVPEYGVEVSANKTLVNFDMRLEKEAVSKNPEGKGFPYCGTTIDCHTLEISRDRERDKDLNITNTLTVDFGRSPGYSFQRKVLNAFKIQSHLMFFDTSHNSATVVHRSLHSAFAETARKMWAYIRCLPKQKQPSSAVIIRTIAKVIDVAFVLLTGKSRKLRYADYECNVRKAQVANIANNAFLEVLSRKQAKHLVVVQWLHQELASAAR